MLDEGSMASHRRKVSVKEKDSTLVFKILEPKTKSELTLESDSTPFSADIYLQSFMSHLLLNIL